MCLRALVASCRAIFVMMAVGFAVVGVSAQEQRSGVPDSEDHSVVFELGAAGDWSPLEGWHPGGTFAFEVTPIESRLELEVGVTALRPTARSRRRSTCCSRNLGAYRGPSNS